jgi:hypothetical protein
MKTISLVILLTGIAAAHAEPFDRRNVFDPQIKDPARITQIISRLDREENEIDGQRKALTKQLITLENAIASLRKLEFERPATLSIPEGIRNIREEKQLANLTTIKPIIGEFDTLVNIIRPALTAVRPIDDAVSQLAASQLTGSQPATIRPQAARIRQTRLRIACDIDDVANYINRVKAFVPPPEASVTATAVALPGPNPAAVTTAVPQPHLPANVTRDVLSCILFAQNLPQPDAIRTAVVADIEAVATETRRALDEVTKNQNEITENKSKWERQLRRAIDISSQLIDWTIPAIGLLVIGLMAVPIFYRTETQASIIESGFILEVFTVFLLISATLVLGIAERIPQEALGTLLGGISGFVLGRSLNKKSDAANGNKDRTAGGGKDRPSADRQQPEAAPA